MTILVPLAAGVEELEAITIIDVLRRAGLSVTTASLTDEKQIQGAHGILIQADSTLNELSPDDFGAIVLAGGGEGTDNLMQDPRIIKTVQIFNEQSKYVCAICAAPTILATAGVLDGLKATCYPTCAEKLEASYTDVPVVADNNIITSQGPGTALLFSLVLVQHFAGEEAAGAVAKAMLTTM